MVIYIRQQGIKKLIQAGLEPYAITDENNPTNERMMSHTFVIILPINYKTVQTFDRMRADKKHDSNRYEYWWVSIQP